VAQAKINLRLRVLDRAPSGYHDIETIFLRLDLGDDVRVRATDDGRRTIDVSGPAVPPGGLGPAHENLAYRAAATYADAAGWPAGFAIALEKRIPVGGGLGGGSADAGAVLRVLDALAPAPLGTTRLLDLAVRLGADVPFMTTEYAMALGTGRGDQLVPLPPPPVRAVLIVAPATGVSTADAYRWVDDRRAGAIPSADVPVESLTSWDAIARAATNDFEPVVAARRPDIASALAALRAANAHIALLSGSGATSFGIFSGEVPADEIGRAAASIGASVIVTQTAERVVAVARDR
jgi:4-diphosphocytidyl-2-C-methyl-D-erythritol kinase